MLRKDAFCSRQVCRCLQLDCLAARWSGDDCSHHHPLLRPPRHLVRPVPVHRPGTHRQRAYRHFVLKESGSNEHTLTHDLCRAVRGCRWWPVRCRRHCRRRRLSPGYGQGDRDRQAPGQALHQDRLAVRCRSFGVSLAFQVPSSSSAGTQEDHGTKRLPPDWRNERVVTRGRMELEKKEKPTLAGD